ncbi:hypothetical protein DNTS_021529 [Danionella cerebrum]|uniref:Uncharacterized protein n=1 Tax=Danionella cerebrum TaxID=2873325 RepID=A0A553QIA1_9TELE|nr:hypothetical protein DNTS_021529 [Danionella translucida]
MSKSASGLPQPRSLSKHDPKTFSVGSLDAASQINPGRLSTSSSRSAPLGSKELLKTSALRNQRRWLATNGSKTDTSSLRYTQDPRRGSLPQDGFRDPNRASRFNWRYSHRHFRSLDNEPEKTPLTTRNGNVDWGPALPMDFQKQRIKGTVGGGGAQKSWDSVSRRDSPKMAAVAPFRFRLQPRDDVEAFLDELSDCSSGSMEVCGEDQGSVRSSTTTSTRDELRQKRSFFLFGEISYSRCLRTRLSVPPHC